MLRVIGQHDAARALYPAAVMDAGARAVLSAKLWIGVPDAVEEDEHGANFVAGRDGEKLIDVFEERLAVVLPAKVVQKYADRVEADRLGPAELAVDRFGIERCGLPHFELVDRRARNEVAANEPGLGVVPFFGALGRPRAGASELRISVAPKEGENEDQQRCGFMFDDDQVMRLVF